MLSVLLLFNCINRTIFNLMYMYFIISIVSFLYLMTGIDTDGKTIDELSLESYLTNGGIFTRFFVMGMQGAADLNKDRGVSLHELYTYVRKHVRQGTDKQQTPIMYGNFNKDAIISYY